MNRIFLGKPSADVESWIKKEFDKKGPLFFEGQEPGASVALVAWDQMNWQPFEHLQCHLECSIDKMATWQPYDGEIIYLDECVGKRAYFRAPEGWPNTNGLYDGQNYQYAHYFKLEKLVKAGGSI